MAEPELASGSLPILRFSRQFSLVEIKSRHAIMISRCQKAQRGKVPQAWITNDLVPDHADLFFVLVQFDPGT